MGLRGSEDPTLWPVRAAAAGEVRRAFNESRIWQASSAPPPFSRRLKSEHNPRPENVQPPGTRSEVWAIWDDRVDSKVAVVHLYRRPDGSTTTPDPKWFAWRGEVLVVQG